MAVGLKIQGNVRTVAMLLHQNLKQNDVFLDDHNIIKYIRPRIKLS